MASKIRKCDYCNQNRTEIKNYPGHPENAVEEYITLTNPELCLFNGDENNLIEYDQWPQQKITKFSVYDEKGHLCQFDTGLIEKNVKLFFSGYVKPIYNDDPSIENGFPTKDLGPINEWFISGFEGGETALIGFNTEFAEYILMEPAEIYNSFMTPIMEKINTSKSVIEYLLDEIDPSFEDLLDKFDAELLIKHSQFICEQVFSFDTSAEIDDTMLITKSCMRSLINLSGVNLENPNSHLRRTEAKCDKIIVNQLIKKRQKNKKLLTNATTTPLVRDTFETFFHGKKLNNFELDRENGENIFTIFNKDAKWIGESIGEDNERVFYEKAILGDDVIQIKDCVLIEVNSSAQVARIFYMFEDKAGNKLIHANWYWRAADTILGETADEFELFYSERCDNIAFNTISHKVDVISNDSDEKFFCNKRYLENSARFEDPITKNFNFCQACLEFTSKKYKNIPRVFEKNGEEFERVLYGLIKFKNENFRINTGVYLKPGSFKFKNEKTKNEKQKDISKNINEDIYPEYYRKVKIIDSIPEPFDIGVITSIFGSRAKIVPPGEIWIRVRKLYRPENTCMNKESIRKLDLNLVYWSEEEIVVPFFNVVVGKCYLAFEGNFKKELLTEGSDRFYFSKTYYPEEKLFGDVSKSAKEFLQFGNNYPKVRKLATLDVFAGCGGLSEGLKQSGVSEVKWAIENDKSASVAYGLNNSNVKIFNDDCNYLLSQIMKGIFENEEGIKLPRKGEVEILCGGPPCQGFSGMNRFNSREYSFFKNSLVATYLSYCDYYRPRFFIMENVRSFVSFKKNMVLKLTLRCLTRMGYQCTFGILQAGNYGVPQTRRRLFIIAAATGEILPNFPEPRHCFSKRGCQLTSLVDNKKYLTNCEWMESAPLRMVNVRDAISDLPIINNGSNLDAMDYETFAETDYQRKLRGNQTILKDHICKLMAPLVQARIELIPKNGSDWRDLPNIIVELSDGTWSKKLEYTYHDEKAGRSSTGALRGVCSCCLGKKCDISDKQYNTLIPWCLPHTGNRHNHWAGLYGRLEWDGFFFTTITNPEPIGKQGRVLHPEQNRVISVRECARSQGFSDNYLFYGNIVDKYRQVGNAVPPPVAAAIGLEIRKCLGLRN
ncbi:DNA (cytosine-5)-methyltransferase PliMCI-like [Leptopilina boulardi]|uniref:DNA (cytosine-5)-methyltransferase PliMCI-like n=1 Tax=Leptopilina boulardi TaxID=63433 RepID=UPI0021F5099E|nr:DNA (cytosine-5)-methyltransferase PliMCI-like [Leptopilina boulardi]